MTKVRLTDRQKQALRALQRTLGVSDEYVRADAVDRSVLAAFDALARKGLVHLRYETGPRGGQHRLVRLTDTGRWHSA